ncbi:hypothetical protein ABL_07087 [Aspergillus niger]|uniref:Uncharacterized protein n=1 Tax=Aspergillus niger TaxID=5061 RepID=A0A100IP17_ASPNG|nr:hypothetical protein ABL_07087 [Aspergillus niger]
MSEDDNSERGQLHTNEEKHLRLPYPEGATPLENVKHRAGEAFEAKTGLMLAHDPVTVQGSVPSAARAGLPMKLWQQPGRSCAKLCFCDPERLRPFFLGIHADSGGHHPVARVPSGRCRSKYDSAGNCAVPARAQRGDSTRAKTSPIPFF